MTTYKNEAINRTGNGIRFVARLKDVTITVYFSGKVLFQGSGAEREANRYERTSGSNTPTPLAKATTSKERTAVRLPSNIGTLSIIGSDETGTGDFFGPITVAACFVSSDQLELVRELGVKDSKQLTDDLMRKIAPDLEATLIHSVLTVPNPKYNEIQQKGYSQGKMKAMLHNQALKNVLKKVDEKAYDYILIDQFAERRTYYNYFENETEIIEDRVLFSTKAENIHLSVAAASIIARVAFLEEMDRMSKELGIELPKGASSKVDEVAARILLKHDEETLKNVTKWHFANTEKAKKLANMKRNF